MKLKICKYCLKSKECPNMSKNVFYICEECYENRKHIIRRPNKIIIYLNNTIEQVDRQLNKEKNVKKIKVLKEVQQKFIKLKQYIHIKIDKGEL